MTAKFIRVESCEDCPHFEHGSDGDECWHEDEYFGGPSERNGSEIPEECPLPDAEETPDAP